MQELIKLLVERTCLNEQNAATAAQTTMEYLKTKMPSMLHGSLEKAFSGVSLEDGIKGEAMDLVGDAKEKLEEFADDAKEKFDEVAGSLKEKLSGLFGGDKKAE